METMNDSLLHRIGYAAGIASILALAACGPQEPESRLKQAADQVEEAKQDVEAAQGDVVEAREDLGSLEAAVHAAEKQLAEARKKLRRKQKQLAEQRNELHSTASDTAIFRLLQRRLLDEKSLSTAAVSADVIDGRVTLRGEVETAEQKATAGDIASGTPGVEKVANLVDVSAGGESSPDK